MNWRRSSGRLATLVASLVLLALSLGPALGSRDVATGDTRLFATARDRLLATSLAQGDGIPRWTPEVWGGSPALASPELGLLYPPGVALAWLDPERAVTLGIALHLVLAAFGVRALARSLGASARASVLAGLAFAFGGALLSIHLAPPQVASNAWLPWFAFGVVRASEGAWARGLAVAAVAQAAIALSGDPQLAVAAALGGFLLAGARGSRAWPRALVAVAASSAAAVVLAAVQVVPALEAFGEQARVRGISSDVALLWSLSPVELVGAVVPFFFGVATQAPSVWMPVVSPEHDRAWLESFYVGPIVLALGAVGLGRLRQSAAARGGLLLVVVFLPLAFGKNTPLYPWLLEHPPTDRFLATFRYPAKLALPAALGLTLLASAGASALGDARERRRLAIALGSLAVLALLGALVSFGFQGRFAAEIDARVAVSHLAAVRNVSGASAMAALPPRFVHVALVAAGGLALALSRRRSRLLAGLVVLVVLDLGLALRPLIFLTEREPFTRAPRVASVLARETERGGGAPARILRTPEARATGPDESGAGLAAADLAGLEGLVPNSGLGRGVQSQEGFTASPPLRSKTVEVIAAVHTLSFARTAILRGARYSLILEGLDFDLGGPFTRVGSVGGRVVVRLDEAPPWAALLGRVRLVHPAQASKSRLEAAAQIVRPDFDPRREVVLETGDALACAPDLAERGTARLDSRFGPHGFELALDAPGPGWLVVRESYGRGWRAWVDGVEAEVVPADVAFRAVHVNAGARRARFAYEAPGLALGGALSAIGAIVLGALVAFFERRARRGRREARAGEGC